MNPKLITNSLINEEYFYMKHPSGLDVYVHPKPSYSSTYAIIGTDFGSINNKFRIKGEESYTVLPDGIAHYLEHKLFESQEGDAFKLFAKTGASANAYTSFEKTAYLFSCTQNFKQSLEILMNFVQSPYFTEENVEKERGIISQEIKMYEDSPDWKMLINLLKALYENHPINIDIAGTVETISKITPELLYKCYNAFYNFNNMALCIAGNVDPEKVFEIVNKNVKFSQPAEIEKYFPEEPEDVAQKSITEKFDIKSSMFNLGFKEHVAPLYRQSVKDLVYTDIILGCISSGISPMYQELMQKELINISSFTSEYLNGQGYASIIFSGESKNPEKAAEIIRKHVDKIKTEGIDKKTFERIKKSVYGDFLSTFDSVKEVANLSLSCALSKNKIFEYTDILTSSCVEEANAMLHKKLNNENSALSMVVPKNE